MENQGTRGNQVSLVPRATQGYQAQKGTLEWQALLVSQALSVQQELRGYLDTLVRLVQEVPQEYQVPEAPLGHQAFQDSLDLKGIQAFQVLLAQLAYQRRASMVPLDHQDPQAQEVMQENQVSQGPRGPRDLQVLLCPTAL